MPDPTLAPHFLRTRRGRALVYQALALCALVAAGWFLWHNTAENLAARQIRSGFGFLAQPSGFDIGETALRLLVARHLPACVRHRSR